ncbi:baseplate J/gp47 family protein [Candidatus Woesebacteria bacterium]|nr:baseplate J/gp47 family protein [Candidatus Woesebacteria bacterium]
MSIKDILPKKEKKKKKEYFWALVIEPSWVQAGIWKIEAGNAYILSSSTPTAWSSDSDLVNASDTALSSAVKKLDEMEDEPNKTVFGVVSSWVDNGEINSEHLEKIKKICEKLDLKPVGFVVIPEAVAHYVRSQEGSPLNALVLGVFEEEIEITIFSLGEIAGKEIVSRSVSVVDDLSEGLARLKITKMPSRFIIYDGKAGELEEVRQTLLKANWDSLSKIEVLHSPRIEILDVEQKVEAVSLAGASELSEVDRIVSDELDEETESENIVHEKETDTFDETNLTEPEEDISPEDFGFVVEQDIAGLTSDEEKTYMTNDNLGSLNMDSTHKEDVLDDKKQTEEVTEDTFVKGKKEKISKVKIALSGIFGKIKGLIRDIFGKRILVIGVGVFILILGGLFALWWYVPKADITIYLTSQQLEENFTIFTDPEITEPDFSESLLPGKSVIKKVEGERTTPATGVKVVGDKATGEVTLYRVGSDLNLNSGTVLNGPNGLDFALDENVSIASGSAGSPGETKARVTALDLGAEYNLASGTTFSVEDYSISDVEARNEESFSGGSSREISAVSESDKVSLKDELTDELTKKAIEEIKGELSVNEMLIEDSIEADEIDVSFSHDVGDEATTLKLEMSTNVNILLIDKNTLANFARELLEDKIPEKFVLRNEQIRSDFDYQGQEDDKYVLGVRVNANLLPAIEPEEIKNTITGKYPFLAEEYFKEEIPGFVRAEIILEPILPGRLKTLPHVSDNIEIEIASER